MYDEKAVNAVGKALYDATRVPGSVTWARMVRDARPGTTEGVVLGFWQSLAVASLDMTSGARARRWGS